MSIRLLRTFVAISENGSFVAAADKMFVTQAAVSQQMKRLEEELSTELFIRGRRSPEMTQAAQALIPQARDILERYDQFVASAKSKSLVAGEIRIGAVPSVMANLVPLALKKVRADFPGVHIRIAPNLSSDLLLQIQRGAVDAAVMSKPEKVHSSLRWQSLANEGLVLAVSMEEGDNDPRTILTNRPYLRMSRRAWISTVADEMLDEMGLTLHDAMELESLETVAGLVAHNLGVAIIPKPCVADDLTRRLRFIPLNVSERYRTIGTLSRSDNAAFPVINAFQTALSDVIEDEKN